MFCKLTAFLLLSGILSAGVRTPHIGSVRCVDGSVRQVYGLPSSFILSQPLVKAVDSASFSDAGGVIAAEGHMTLLDSAGSPVADFAVRDKAALVNIDTDGSAAIGWLPGTHSVVYWDGKLFKQTILKNGPEGRVTSIRRRGEMAELLVLDGPALSQITVSLHSGDTVSEAFLAGVDAPAFQMDDFIVFLSTEGLEVDGPDGARRTLAVPTSDLVVERMASEWLHLTSPSSGQHWALHITGKLLEVSQLPTICMQECGK